MPHHPANAATARSPNSLLNMQHPLPVGLLTCVWLPVGLKTCQSSNSSHAQQAARRARKVLKVGCSVLGLKSHRFDISGSKAQLPHQRSNSSLVCGLRPARPGRARPGMTLDPLLWLHRNSVRAQQAARGAREVWTVEGSVFEFKGHRFNISGSKAQHFRLKTQHFILQRTTFQAPKRKLLGPKAQHFRLQSTTFKAPKHNLLGSRARPFRPQSTTRRGRCRASRAQNEWS